MASEALRLFDDLPEARAAEKRATAPQGAARVLMPNRLQMECSFDETVSSVARTTGGQVPKRQAEGMVAEVAQDFEAFYETREATAPEGTSDPLIMSLDGKGIVMRREDLREATRKAAEREQHKLKTRLSAREKRNRKRMATVATVYSISPHERSA